VPGRYWLVALMVSSPAVPVMLSAPVVSDKVWGEGIIFNNQLYNDIKNIFLDIILPISYF
jgi:hypothetical protein